MTCYHPIHGYLIPDVGFRMYDLRGKGRPQTVPCGQCIGCRQMRSIHTAIRCVHESQTHERNCFITLTFNDQHNPWTLDHTIWQLFMKRLRRQFHDGIKFYMCGEYGDQYGRPHFHACLFGVDFDDRVLIAKRADSRLYTSEHLQSIWTDPISKMPLGFVSIGDVSFQSAGYISRYIMKRITGPDAEEHYRGRKPEYNRFSNRHAIGYTWFQKYGMTDVYPHDRVILKGKRLPVPRYYDRLLELADPYMLDEVKHNRYLNFKSLLDDHSPDRLLVKEAVHSARLSLLTRGVDNVT
nr:MAG: replication initiator protein [Microvirus sp.]